MLSSPLTLINLLLLGLVHGLFVRFTTPSPTIQPLLHSVFGIVIRIYSLLTRQLFPRLTSRLAALGSLCLSLLIFGIVWSAGIVAVTQFMSWLIATQGSSEVSLFYETGGKPPAHLLLFCEAILSLAFGDGTDEVYEVVSAPHTSDATA